MVYASSDLAQLLRVEQPFAGDAEANTQLTKLWDFIRAADDRYPNSQASFRLSIISLMAVLEQMQAEYSDSYPELAARYQEVSKRLSESLRAAKKITFAIDHL